MAMATIPMTGGDSIVWTDQVAIGVALFWGCRPDQIVHGKCGVYRVCHDCADEL